MASPPIPPSLEHLAERVFSFYPAIVNVQHNEWRLQKATWSEIQVSNCGSGAEFWIPRRFLGEIVSVEDPVLIVGLNRELEMKRGMVIPCQRRVLAMPAAVGPPERTGGDGQHLETRPMTGIRLEKSDRRVIRLLLVTVATLVVLYVVALGFLRVGELRQKNPVLVGSDQSYFNLASHDDFVGVTQKIGPPTSDRQQESGTILYRALGYPARGYTVILMGRDPSSMTYIGTVNRNWDPVHAVNAQTESLLRQLPASLRNSR